MGPPRHVDSVAARQSPHNTGHIVLACEASGGYSVAPMEPHHDNPRWSLPYSSPVPSDPRHRKGITAARIAGYVLLAGILIAPVVSFQISTMRRQAKAGQIDEKSHKGAIGRWSYAVREFWAGKNIYRRPDETNDDVGQKRLHPNMPFTVILLTPFAYMPVPAMALTFNVLKVAALIASLLMAAQIAGHGRRRIPDWVLGLAVLWAALLIVGDIQHGNTNSFVLFAIVLHLWLYRRGRDLGAGAALTVAICLKMTPALFVLYWLYQRNWKLLVGVVAATVLLAVVIPGAAVGPERYATVTRTWMNNLILPGLVKGAWYPIHINQSLPGVASRYFFAEPSPNGDIFWNPDDYEYGQHPKSGWIAVASLSEQTVKMIVRVGQVLILALMAWSIGWRKLPRDDGRRALHYGLVVTAMLLMNQRTWDHHAGILLLATVAIWQGLAYGRMSNARRWTAFLLLLAAGLCIWLSRSEAVKLFAKIAGGSKDDGEHWKNMVEAYGAVFLHFVLLFAAGVVVALGLKKSPTPYAETVQKLGGREKPLANSH